MNLPAIILGFAVILMAIFAIYRRIDVRLSLILAALALGALSGNLMAIVRKFLQTFADEKFVVPICSAMGFAYVMRLTQCDQHLVQLLVRPLRRVRSLLIPGTVVVGFLVNVPIVSQTSTAVTIGPVVIPILLAARISPITTGAALLLGCSIGGELLNPGAPELRTTIEESEKAAKAKGLPPLNLSGDRCVRRILPLNTLGLLVATIVFWAMNRSTEAGNNRDPSAEEKPPDDPPPFQVNHLKALVPLVPLILLYVLYVLGPGLGVYEVPFDWLENTPKDKAPPGRFDSRLIGAAMLIGVAVAALVVRQAALGVASAFFEGAGYGFTHIISLIVAANCFGEGISGIGIARLIGDMIQAMPALLLPLAGLLSLGFAVLCGSGMASTQSLFGFFAGPALDLGMDPAHAGAVVSLASAAGRTMSPVAAVVLMAAAMTRTDPLTLARRAAVPLLAAVAAIVIAAMILAPSP